MCTSGEEPHVKGSLNGGGYGGEHVGMEDERPEISIRRILVSCVSLTKAFHHLGLIFLILQTRGLERMSVS